MLDPSYVAENSTPGTSSMPASAAAAAASSRPSEVSWSVSATTSSERSRASRTTSVGEYVPSDAVECACRSIPAMERDMLPGRQVPELRAVLFDLGGLEVAAGLRDGSQEPVRQGDRPGRPVHRVRHV